MVIASGQNTNTKIFVDPTAAECTDTYCGLSSCPCDSLKTALASAYSYNNGSATNTNITISCAPGNYSGTDNSDLVFSSPIPILLM